MKIAKTGHVGRVLDIPVQAITDEKSVPHFKRAPSLYYGEAIKAFLHGFIKLFVTERAARQQVEQLVGEALERLTPLDATTDQKRALKRFALTEAAGRLACQLKVLPFSEDVVISAVKKVTRDWLESASELSDVDRGIAALRSFILKNRDARFKKWNADFEANRRDVAGYINQENGEYYILSDGFKEALKGYNIQEVAGELKNRSLLVGERNASYQAKRYIGPAGERIRPLFYVIKKELLGESELSDKNKTEQTKIELACDVQGSKEEYDPKEDYDPSENN